MSPGRILPVAGLLIAAMCAILPYRPYTFMKGDALIYGFMSRSLAKDHDLYLAGDLPFSLGADQERSYLSMSRTGRLVPKHSPLLPLLALPLYLLLGFNGLLLFNAGLYWALFWIIRPHLRRGAGPLLPLAVLATLTQPILLHYIYNFSPDLLASVILFLAISASLRERDGLFGFVSALLILVRPVFVIQFILGLVIAKRSIRYLLGAAVPLLIFAGYNTALFGAPWITSYQRVAVRAGDAVVLHSHAELIRFDAGRILKVLFRLPDGFLWTSALSAWEMILLLRSRRIGSRMKILIGGTVLWQVLFLWFYEAWDTSSYGVRFLLPVTVVLVFALLPDGGKMPGGIVTAGRK